MAMRLYTRFNPGVSVRNPSRTEYVNAAMKVDTLQKHDMEQFVLLLAPFAPHIAEELWQLMGHTETLAYEQWPQCVESLLVEEEIELPVQVNGKVRAKIKAPVDAGKDELLELAKASPLLEKYLAGKQLVKEIVVPGRMINLVVKG